MSLLQDDNRGYRTWSISQIYQGGTVVPPAVVVPNPGDHVFSNTGILKVDSVGPPPNYIPVMSMYMSLADNQQQDNLVSAISGYQPNVLCPMFVDASVVPNTIVPDSKFSVNDDVAYFKYFLGNDTSQASGVVISQMYNQAGDLVGENVPAVDVGPNGSLEFRPQVANVGQAIADGTIITAVAYKSSGLVVSQTAFVAYNSAATRGLNSTTDFLVDVQLVSSLISTVESDLIEVQAGLPIQSTDFSARLIYNSGAQSSVMPVDGNKLKLLGFDNFNGTLGGQVDSVVLAYYPDPNEPFINGGNGGTLHLDRQYRVKSINLDPDFAFRIYMVPHFLGSNSWRMDYYLTNAAGDINVKIPNNVITAHVDGTDPFPLAPAPTTPRVVTLSVDIQDVIPGYASNYTLVQTQTITLNNPTVGSNDPWLIDYLGNGTVIYGSGLYVSVETTGSERIYIAPGITSTNLFIEKYYENLSPVWNESADPQLPTITHFQVRRGSTVGAVRSISDYNNWIPKVGTDPWVSEETIEIILLQEISGEPTKLIRGIAPVRVQLQ